MAEKRGKGGYGSEKFDPETGRYIAEDTQFHAGANISVNELIDMLKSGYFDDPEQGWDGSQFFANDKDEETEEDEDVWQNKNAIISYLQEEYDKAYTKQAIMDTNFPEITEKEYREYYTECLNNTTVKDRAAFNNEYKGAGEMCFEFNKALRFGLNNFYSVYPQYKNSAMLNPTAITERAKKLDNLTNSWSFPEDKKVIRFVDTAPLISWFKDSGIFEGLKTYTNEYNLEMLREGYDKQELVNRLNTLVGTKVPPDGSFTSFSCLSDASHMAKHLDNNKRHILIRYNVRQGTKAFISDYGYESEGLFNRTTGFFIQGASLEKIGNHEVVVLEYGIQ